MGCREGAGWRCRWGGMRGRAGPTQSQRGPATVLPMLGAGLWIEPRATGAPAGSRQRNSSVPKSMDSTVRILQGAHREASTGQLGLCPQLPAAPSILIPLTQPFRQIAWNAILKPKPSVKNVGPGAIWLNSNLAPLLPEDLLCDCRQVTQPLCASVA